MGVSMIYIQLLTCAVKRENLKLKQEKEIQMALEAQVNSNRQNSQKSTGPLTAEENAAGSKNALKNGFFAEEKVIDGENITDYEAYLESSLSEMEPEGINKTMLIERFVILSLRLKHAGRFRTILKSFAPEAATRSGRKNNDLKKQSQFPLDVMGVNPFMH